LAGKGWNVPKKTIDLKKGLYQARTTKFWRKSMGLAPDAENSKTVSNGKIAGERKKKKKKTGGKTRNWVTPVHPFQREKQKRRQQGHLEKNGRGSGGHSRSGEGKWVPS